MTGTMLNVWITVACTTAMTLFGYDQGVFGGIIVTPDFLQTMGNPNPNLQGTIVSLYDIGCFFGAMSAFVFGERFGRKKTLMIAIIQASSFSVAQLIVSRLVTATLPELGMEIPYRFQLVFSVILFATVPWLPESPRWLLAHGQHEEGLNILAALEGDGATPQDDFVINQRDIILDAVRIEREHAPSWSDILKGRTGDTGMISRLFLGAGTQWMQQLVGINVTSYYLPLVLQNSVGLSNQLARLLAACNSLSYLFFSFAGLLLIERAGRRKLMMWGAAGQCVCYIFISALLSQSDGSASGLKFGAGATAFSSFITFSSGSAGRYGVPWLYPTEINSLSMRTKGAALGTASNWISNYIVVQITPTGIATLGWRFYIIWAVFNAIFVPLIWLIYPETANRQLEDIDRLYREGKSSIFVFRNKEATQVERPQRFIDADDQRLEAKEEKDRQSRTENSKLE
ncbi:hypothetical protein BJ912DRAFT_1020959 [Pholiota molesta]|nr:hypothetical protein BJ912DRAFT_1020959 [Pholiota molesta]